MKVLESAPERYELGLRMLTLGKIQDVYERMTDGIQAGQVVLDLGCGTGALAIRAARRGARVKAIDINPGMLAIARRHACDEGVADAITFVEKGAVELDSESGEAYDQVLSSLFFSELSEAETGFILKEISRILKPGGWLQVADEVVPGNILLRWLHALIRLPWIWLTYLFTQTTTHAVTNLPQQINMTGLVIQDERRSRFDSFVEIQAQKPRMKGE